MKNHKFQNIQSSLFFFDKILYQRSSPERVSANEKLPDSVVKKADAKYFRICRATMNVPNRKFNARLKKIAAVPQQINKRLGKLRNFTAFEALRPKKAAKFKNLLLEKVSKVTKLTNPEAVKAQAAWNIKTLAEKYAGYTPPISDKVTFTKGPMVNAFRNIISPMNGKVPTVNLMNAISQYTTITRLAVDDAIQNSQNNIGNIGANIDRFLIPSLKEAGANPTEIGWLTGTKVSMDQMRKDQQA